MIRVLIADDSPTQRRLIRAIVESDPELAVAGEARTGEEAVTLCPRLKPDLVTMDILMPGMGGYDAIRQIMSESPRPILVLTAIDARQLMDVSFKALGLGALAVVAKPVGLPQTDPAALTLIAQIKTMAGVKVIRRTWRPIPGEAGIRPDQAAAAPLTAPDGLLGPVALPPLPPLPPAVPQRPAPQVVAVGVSTGGPPALEILLKSLSPDFPLPIAVVQHISIGFVGGLARWLSEATGRRCVVANRGDVLQPGITYFAPDEAHMIIKPGGLVWLDPGEPVGNHRPAANMLLQSVARNYGPAAIGVVMTGMGEDGARGLLAMRQAGASTLVQDEETCVVFGMPKAALDLRAAEEVLPLGQLGPRIQLLGTFRR